MSELELPVKVVPLESEVAANLDTVLAAHRDLLRGEPGRFLMGRQFWDVAKKIYNMEVRPDDTWIVTYPKCGTTWTQEMIWLIANDCDFERAKVPLIQRFPFLEMKVIMPEDAPHADKFLKFVPSIDDIEKLPSPRFIKSHLPFHLLPPNLLEVAKVVYVTRNPKDVITSFYHHHNHLQLVEGTFEQFADCFIRDEVNYGSFFNHVKEAWEKREHRNLHFMFYEDMKKDLRSEILKLATFLNKTLSEEQTNALVEHQSFQSFKNNPAVNAEFLKDIGVAKKDTHFIRKGVTGDWKNHFSDELNQRVNQWIQDNLEGSTLPFKYEM